MEVEGVARVVAGGVLREGAWIAEAVAVRVVTRPVVDVVRVIVLGLGEACVLVVVVGERVAV